MLKKLISGITPILYRRSIYSGHRYIKPVIFNWNRFSKWEIHKIYLFLLVKDQHNMWSLTYNKDAYPNQLEFILLSNQPEDHSVNSSNKMKKQSLIPHSRNRCTICWKNRGYKAKSIPLIHITRSFRNVLLIKQ